MAKIINIVEHFWLPKDVVREWKCGSFTVDAKEMPTKLRQILAYNNWIEQHDVESSCLLFVKEYTDGIKVLFWIPPMVMCALNDTFDTGYAYLKQNFWEELIPNPYPYSALSMKRSLVNAGLYVPEP